MKKNNNAPFEIINPNIQRGQIQQAVFDFDGTLSLIREGWKEIMVAMMVEVLMATPGHKPEDELAGVVSQAIDRLTGWRTIHQMIYLVEKVQQCGGSPENAETYKQRFLQRLQARVAERKAMLTAGLLSTRDLMVPNAISFLEILVSRGITCTLASGSDDQDVKEEARLLGLSPYFSAIHGARDGDQHISKRMILDSILADYHFSGPELVVFGDGYAEIKDAHAAGAITVGVASDEITRQGLNPVKRSQLVEAGADLVISNYRCHEELVAYLFDDIG